jgi:uncharacterized membrane protein
MLAIEDVQKNLQDAELALLEDLRCARRNLRELFTHAPVTHELTLGQRIADNVAATMGSWPFIIIQSMILLVWIFLNLTAYVNKWDPYPFILLNLALSFQAAYAAPFIMMSQNRQSEIDRRAAENDHQINVKAELEVEHLHRKLDALRETEIMYLSKAVHDLVLLLQKSGICEPEYEHPQQP